MSSKSPRWFLLDAALAVLLCASCSPRQAHVGAAPSGPAADPLEAILRASDAGEAASDVPRIVREELDAQVAAKIPFDAERVRRARQAVAELWTAEKLLARVRRDAGKQLSARDVEEVVRVLGAKGMAPLASVGARARRAERAAVDAWLASANEPASRTELHVRFLQATGVIDAQRVAVDLPVRAAAEISNELLARASDEESQRVAEVAQQFGSRQLPGDFEDAMVPATGWALRDVSGAQLEQALAFWESELGQRYRAALEQAFVRAVEVSTAQTLKLVRAE